MWAFTHSTRPNAIDGGISMSLKSCHVHLPVARLMASDATQGTRLAWSCWGIKLLAFRAPVAQSPPPGSSQSRVLGKVQSTQSEDVVARSLPNVHIQGVLSCHGCHLEAIYHYSTLLRAVVHAGFCRSGTERRDLDQMWPIVSGTVASHSGPLSSTV